MSRKIHARENTDVLLREFDIDDQSPYAEEFVKEETRGSLTVDVELSDEIETVSF